MDKVNFHHYMSYGKKKINKTITDAGNEYSYTFILLNVYNVTNFIHPCCLFNSKKRRLVILSNRHFMPLAMFYYHCTGSIVTVLESKTPLDEIVRWLIFINGSKVLPKYAERFRALSYSDVNLFRLIISGFSISSIAQSLGVNKKSVYSRKIKISSMMNVRRIGDLFLSQSC